MLWMVWCGGVGDDGGGIAAVKSMIFVKFAVVVECLVGNTKVLVKHCAVDVKGGIGELMVE